MLKVISCFEHQKKDGSGKWYELNLLDEDGHVATGIFSDTAFPTNSNLTGVPSLIYSKAAGKYVVGIRKLVLMDGK